MTLDENTLITFENIGLRYNNQNEILKDINLNIKKGDFIFLIGESGAGKSSLLNLINCSLFPSRGFLNILGNDVSKITSFEIALLRRRIGVIFQNFKLIEHLSVYENIALPLKIANIPFKEINERVEEILDWINLKEFKDSYPRVLSGGQQQRVSIARAVINKPDIILADEPTGSIDSKMADKILNMLNELNKQNVAIIFATHSLDLLENHNHPIMLLENHRLKKVR